MMRSVVKVTHFCFPVLTTRIGGSKNGKILECQKHDDLYL